MGVRHLWGLLGPAARRADVRALALRRVAVDLSIWLAGFRAALSLALGAGLSDRDRDRDRGDTPANILRAFFRRLCRLLFLDMRPVLVFDGTPPALKERMLRRRREAAVRREENAESRRVHALAQTMLGRERAREQQQQQQQSARSGAHAGGRLADAATSPPPPRPLAVATAAAPAVPAPPAAGASSSAAQDGGGRLVPDTLETLDESAVAGTPHTFSHITCGGPGGGIDWDTVAELPAPIRLEVLRDLERVQRVEPRVVLERHGLRASPAEFSARQLQRAVHAGNIVRHARCAEAEMDAAARWTPRPVASDPSLEYVLVRGADADALSADADAVAPRAAQKRPREAVTDDDGANDDRRPPFLPPPPLLPPPPPPLSLAIDVAVPESVAQPNLPWLAPLFPAAANGGGTGPRACVSTPPGLRPPHRQPPPAPDYRDELEPEQLPERPAMRMPTSATSRSRADGAGSASSSSSLDEDNRAVAAPPSPVPMPPPLGIPSYQPLSEAGELGTAARELVRLFGCPYVDSPCEAEAQCAVLLELGLVSGIVTEDSDVLLFGGDAVYRHLFSRKHDPVLFLMQDIEADLGLTRTRLVELALLLGCDYCEGVDGIGPKSALEIVLGEGRLRARVESHPRARAVRLVDSFPLCDVIDAYMHPRVDRSEVPLVWRRPDLVGLRAFAARHCGWDAAQVDALLVPVLSRTSM